MENNSNRIIKLVMEKKIRYEKTSLEILENLAAESPSLEMLPRLEGERGTPWMGEPCWKTEALLHS